MCDPAGDTVREHAYELLEAAKSIIAAQAAGYACTICSGWPRHLEGCPVRGLEQAIASAEGR